MDSQEDIPPAKGSWIERNQTLLTWIGTIISIVGLLIAAYQVGYDHGNDAPSIVVSEPISRTVDAHGYPQPMNMQLENGDIIRIKQRVPDDIWNCGRGDATILGVVERDNNNLAHDAYFCSIIYGISDGDAKSIDFFSVGPDLEFEADNGGTLYLGVNDSVGVGCSHIPDGDCYKDNEGVIRLEILVTQHQP